jgi:RNA polymerase sigma-70 factor, ECF subfamily
LSADPEVVDLTALCRAEWGGLLAALIRDLGDFDLAEDALQEAFAAALTAWSVGVPANARGWLYTAARNSAIDQLRRRARIVQKQEALAALTAAEAAVTAADAEIAEEDPHPREEAVVPDERLRLIFTCCHPALASEAQVALTLRTLGGLSTEEIARAFLVPTTTMAQRLVRAKAKIRAAAIPYRVPSAAELPERLETVMAVLYLVFNEGHAAAQGEALVRHELCAEAIRLARLLRGLLPTPSAELDALLALMLLHDARRPARIDDTGNLVLLADQDRTRWHRAQIDEGRALVLDVLARGPPGSLALEAAIAAVHGEAARAEDTDWRQIVGLYDQLYRQHPSPVVALNRAVAVSMAQGPAVALPLVEALAGALGEYHPFHVTRADLLRRLGRLDESIASYQQAHARAGNEVERRFLEGRVAALREPERPGRV